MKTKRNLLVKTAFLVLLFAVTANSQTLSRNFTANELGNLRMGIQSDNTGLKRDCIFFAAKYKVDEMVDILVDEFKKESEPRNRVLMALALYNIGSQNGIEAIYQASLNDTDTKVRKRCFEIMNMINEEKLVSVH